MACAGQSPLWVCVACTILFDSACAGQHLEHMDALKFEPHACGGVETRTKRLFLDRNSSETLKFKRKCRTVANSYISYWISMNSLGVLYLQFALRRSSPSNSANDCKGPRPLRGCCVASYMEETSRRRIPPPESSSDFNRIDITKCALGADLRLLATRRAPLGGSSHRSE